MCSSGRRRRRCSSTRWTSGCEAAQGPDVRKSPRLMRSFAYERPDRLEDAVALLAGGGARLLAGGTDLIIRLRDGTVRPDVVVDVKGLAEIDDGLHVDGDRLVIGGQIGRASCRERV